MNADVRPGRRGATPLAACSAPASMRSRSMMRRAMYFVTARAISLLRIHQIFGFRWPATVFALRHLDHGTNAVSARPAEPVLGACPRLVFAGDPPGVA
jgi:hypothetical protein